MITPVGTTFSNANLLDFDLCLALSQYSNPKRKP